MCLSTDDGPNVNLSNNSEGNMYEYQPPRPFQAELYFALKWDRNTDWFRNRVKVNLTIKCDGQVVYVSPQLPHPSCYSSPTDTLRSTTLVLSKAYLIT